MARSGVSADERPLPPAVFLAGGRGSRLAEVAGGLPKVLVEVGGRPMLAQQLRVLHREGLREAVMLLGIDADRIRARLGDECEGVSLRYVVEGEPLGTAGALRAAWNELPPEFLLVNGDIVFDFDLAAAIDFHRRSSALATLFVHPNDHPHDSDLVECDADGKVTAFHAKPHPEGRFFHNMVNAGIAVLDRSCLEVLPEKTKGDLNRHVLPEVLARGRLWAWRTAEYLKDMGTPERLEKVRKDWDSGLVASWHRRHRRPAVFFDRDGTLNLHVDQLHRVEDLRLLPGAAKAVRLANRAGFLAVLVTNQPALARNLLDEKGLDRIHAKLEWLLGEEGAWLDAVYFCPHHPHKGFPEENPALKIDCDCRKPKAGMVFRAAEERRIDLSRSFLIGDGEADRGCAEAAEIPWFGVGRGSLDRWEGTSVEEAVKEGLRRFS